MGRPAAAAAAGGQCGGRVRPRPRASAGALGAQGASIRRGAGRGGKWVGRGVHMLLYGGCFAGVKSRRARGLGAGSSKPRGRRRAQGPRGAQTATGLLRPAIGALGERAPAYQMCRHQGPRRGAPADGGCGLKPRGSTSRRGPRAPKEACAARRGGVRRAGFVGGSARVKPARIKQRVERAAAHLQEQCFPHGEGGCMPSAGKSLG